MQSTFKDCHLTRVFYQDFWSLPQFGRTRLGQLLSIGKSGQSMLAIEELAREGLPVIQGILDRFDIQAVAFAPHSVPRKTLFLKAYARFLSLKTPLISFQKVHVDGVAIAQKTLSKLSERIQNAKESIFLSDVKIPFERVLLIDDVLGSRSTLNEMTAKSKQKKSVKEIYAFAIVGSLKGSDVISEV